MKPQYELADIIRRYKIDFYSGYKVLAHHKRVLKALEKCRTVALGGHVEQCDECGDLRISYNSCRNRHCPKCQGIQRNKWIKARLSESLDCKYFHTVFTIPDSLNYYCMHYPKAMYSILFKSSRETLECFGNDEKYLGAEIGCIGILHTWGQKLDLHPHVHYIVPAVGIDPAGNWRTTRSGGKYLFPVKGMSGVFRGKFVSLLKEFFEAQSIAFTEELRHDIYEKDWVVYAKRPFGGASQVIEYLGRYTHKIAISNHRIQSIDNGKVIFSYKDYCDESKVKTMTLSATEFLRRFCIHILPKGFRKIRHYGILSSRKKKKLRELQTNPGVEKAETDAIVYIQPDFKVKICPCCGKGEMLAIMSFKANAPPSQDFLNEFKNNNLKQSISSAR